MKKRYITFAWIIALIAMTFASCDDFEGEQQMPSFIKIEGFNLVANPNTSFGFPQDSSFLTSDITEVALYASDGKEQKTLGIYTLGKDGTLNIPLLYKGKTYLEIRPVVRLNGMNATRTYYPFYSSILDTVDLKEGEISVISKQDISYTDNTKIEKRFFFEDTFNPFENASNIDSSAENHFVLISSSDSVRYGSKCGGFYSTSSKDNFKVISKDSISSSTRSGVMILELDYCANIPFEVGIYGKASSSSQSYYISSVRMSANFDDSYKPNDAHNWQKMYITLGKVWENINHNAFQLWFMPYNSANNPKGFVHIDNIKLVTYKGGK